MNPTSRYAYSRNGDLGRVDEKCLVRVQIPVVDSTDGGKVRYHVRITNIRSGQVWEAPRRFSEFLQLRNELIHFFSKTDKKCPGCRNYEKVLNLFEFPRKHVFTSVTPVVINYRKIALCNFVALLASHTFTTTPKCPTCSGFPFTSVRDWLTTGGENGPAAANGEAVGFPTIEAIRDSIRVKDFINYHPVSNAMPVDQEGRFVGSTVPNPLVLTSPTKQTDNKCLSPSRLQLRQHTPKGDTKSPLHYDDNSSTGYSSSPPSPPSVDEFVIPAPVPVKSSQTRASCDIDAEREDGDESISSTASSIDLEDQKESKPPASNDSPSCRMKTVEKDNSNTIHSSSSEKDEASFEQPCTRSMTGTNDEDDEDDETLNMDFMNLVPVAIK